MAYFMPQRGEAVVIKGISVTMNSKRNAALRPSGGVLRLGFQFQPDTPTP